MTMSKGLKEDVLNTINEILKPGKYIGKNWLRHGGPQEKVIDELLIKGASEEKMAREIIRRGFDRNNKGFVIMLARVRNHIGHMSPPISSTRDGGAHGLPLIQENGRWKFDPKKMEQIIRGDTADNSSPSPALYLPNKADVEFVESQLRKSLDEVIGIEDVLDQVEVNFSKAGKPIKDNWREITRRNIEIWFGRRS